VAISVAQILLLKSRLAELRFRLAKAGDYDESKHPRDEKGRFGSGGGSTKTYTPPKDFTEAHSKHLASLPDNHSEKTGALNWLNTKIVGLEKEAADLQEKNQYSKPSYGGRFGDLQRREAREWKQHRAIFQGKDPWSKDI